MADRRKTGGKRKATWTAASDLFAHHDTSIQVDTTIAPLGLTSSSTNAQQQPARSLNTPSSTTPMNSYAASQTVSRQTPRLQNTQKPPLGNGTGGWGGFGMPSSGGAFAGLGGAPGLGAQARPSQLSGFAQVIGGGSNQGPIDMSDFPSLSGGPRPQQNSTTSAGWNSTSIRQPSTHQPQHPQPRAPSAAPSQQSLEQLDGQRARHPSGDRTDDFPPLGGQTNGDSFPQSNGFPGGYGSPVTQQSRTSSQPGQLPIREGSGSYSQNQHQSIQHPSSQNGQIAQSGTGMKKYAEMTDSEKWGLPGLMAALESRKQVESGGPGDDTLPPAMRSTVIMGHDLNSLGLDLDSSDPIYPTFTPFQAVGSSGSTFDFHDRHIVPDFTLPSAYTVTNVPPLSSRMSAFSDETLFSIFYQYPRDVLQEMAAHELINRDWRWHKVLRQWLQKDTRETNSSSSLPLVDLTNGAPVGAQPIRKSERVEQGVYVFFDASNWRRERRVLDLDYESLDPPRLVAGMNGAGGAGGMVGPALGAAPAQQGPGRLMTDGGGGLAQQSGVGSSQIPSA